MRSFILTAKRGTSCLVILLTLTFQNLCGQGFSESTTVKLQQVIEEFRQHPAHGFAGGMSVAIQVDGLAKWKGATGYAARNVDAQNNLLPGGEPFSVNTISQIYSITKTFTAPLVLELAKEGVLRLEDPVSAYLPMAAINPNLNSQVTIRQLLAHESGFSDYVTEFDLQVLVAFQPGRAWNAFELLSFVHQIQPPGTVRRYSSTNYIMLGAIVEARTGKLVEQHFRERFFNPLGLKSMYFAIREQPGNRGVPASPHDNISAFNPVFQLTGQPVFPDGITNISRFPMTAIVSLAFTGGGIVSDVSDVAAWGCALFGGRATSRSTLDAMLNSIAAEADPDGDKLGYGIFTNTKISETDFFVGHNGNAVGYRSLMFYQPDRKMTIAILCNDAGADLYAVAKALYETLPDFTCGNDNRHDESGDERKIKICFKGKSLCIARSAADVFIKKGACLGDCELRQQQSPGKEITEHVSGDRPPVFSIYPNPSTGKSTISFTCDKTGQVSLYIFNSEGKLVSSAFNGFMEKGAHENVAFTAGNLPVGIYIARLKTESGSVTRKLVLKR